MADETPTTPGYRTADWAGENARRWALHAERLEAQLEPVADVLFDAAALAPGMRTLDVGCGRGATTRRAARIVGERGKATGLDVAANLIDEARIAASDLPNVDWIVADAQHHLFAPAHDALISRFGVMFFDDARAAFANLRAACAPGATLTMVTWQRRDRSPLFEVPLSLGRSIAAHLGLQIDGDAVPADGGPFSFGDPDRMRAILVGAGWRGIDIELMTLPLYSGGPGSVADAADVSLGIGPLRAALESGTDAHRAAVRERLIDALKPYHDGVGVRLDGAIAITRCAAF